MVKNIQLRIGSQAAGADQVIDDPVITLEDGPGRLRWSDRAQLLVQAGKPNLDSLVNRLRVVTNDVLLLQPGAALPPPSQATNGKNVTPLATLLDVITTLLAKCFRVLIDADVMPMRWASGVGLRTVIPIMTGIAPPNQTTDGTDLTPLTRLINSLNIPLKCIPVPINADAEQMRWRKWSLLLPVIPTQ